MYYESNIFLFLNATKIYQFLSKISEITYYTLCLGNISKTFAINNKNKKTKKNGIRSGCNFFSVNFNPTDIINIIHKYLMKKKHDIKMFG